MSWNPFKNFGKPKDKPISQAPGAEKPENITGADLGEIEDRYDEHSAASIAFANRDEEDIRGYENPKPSTGSIEEDQQEQKAA